MRDFFAVMMVGALLFSSLLYWIMAWFITGILSSTFALFMVLKTGLRK
jgi:hypothetical protein